MEIQQWWALGAGFVAGMVFAWAAAAWWFGRGLRRAEAMRLRLENARQFAAQQASQARRQIETLQQELGEMRQRLARGRNAATVAAAMVAAPQPVAAPNMPERNEDGDGFADTQLLPPQSAPPPRR